MPLRQAVEEPTDLIVLFTDCLKRIANVLFTDCLKRIANVLFTDCLKRIAYVFIYRMSKNNHIARHKTSGVVTSVACLNSFVEIAYNKEKYHIGCAGSISQNFCEN